MSIQAFSLHTLSCSRLVNLLINRILSHMLFTQTIHLYFVIEIKDLKIAVFI